MRLATRSCVTALLLTGVALAPAHASFVGPVTADAGNSWSVSVGWVGIEGYAWQESGLVQAFTFDQQTFEVIGGDAFTVPGGVSVLGDDGVGDWATDGANTSTMGSMSGSDLTGVVVGNDFIASIYASPAAWSTLTFDNDAEGFLSSTLWVKSYNDGVLQEWAEVYIEVYVQGGSATVTAFDDTYRGVGDPIPEPTSLALLGIGLGATIARRVRKRCSP